MLDLTGHSDDAMREVVDLMRALSKETEPQAAVRLYRDRVRRLIPFDATIAVSRRDLEAPWYRITRASTWKDEVNPWTQKDRLPLHDRGLLGELIYRDEPTIINDLRPDPADPAFELLSGFGSLFAQPQYDQGVAKNMVIALRRERNAFDPRTAPTLLWLTNLFGRATHNLVLAKQLAEAYELVDRELQAVSEIQRALLPVVLPDVPGLSLSAHYQTSKQAGGDYYDFFPQPDGTLGMLIADVSGHGTPAAVLMAITHTMAHLAPAASSSPGMLLGYLNAHLADSYQRTGTGFVTAFYAIYDPRARSLRYASAGHNPPRIRRGDGAVEALEAARDLPLGVLGDTEYAEASASLRAGESLVLYTDGITEARNREGQLFGEFRLDRAIERTAGPSDRVVAGILDEVGRFTRDRAAEDDRTLVVASASA
jgi:sigma-B regulation protein RsbU (phosphoserine phosphatase)